jgi:hypothetical protein
MKEKWKRDNNKNKEKEDMKKEMRKIVHSSHSRLPV